jgi:hypothetical protein
MARTGFLRFVRLATPARKGLTWYAVAKLAGIPNFCAYRDIETGRNAELANAEAAARVRGLGNSHASDRNVPGST